MVGGGKKTRRIAGLKRLEKEKKKWTVFNETPLSREEGKQEMTFENAPACTLTASTEKLRTRSGISNSIGRKGFGACWYGRNRMNKKSEKKKEKKG